MLKPTFFQAIRAQAEHMQQIAQLEGMLMELHRYHKRKGTPLTLFSEKVINIGNPQPLLEERNWYRAIADKISKLLGTT